MRNRIFTLFEFNQGLRTVLESEFPDRYLITAEIASIRTDQKGHCYLELIERGEAGVIAQARATVWSYAFRAIAARFRAATGMSLAKGIRVLLEAEVSFHERYGLSLNVTDIDPSYTLGEMALKRKEILDRLVQEGLLDRNRRLEFPLVPLRLAVISSPGAAGYEDFVRHVERNPYDYRFALTLFSATMQGDRVESSIVAALQRCGAAYRDFDVVIIIRGGGGEAELHAFDSYEIGKAIANLPLPVISGIGHERDKTVVDEVCNISVKTPTAAAELVVRTVREFHLLIISLEERLVDAQRNLVREYSQHLYRRSRDMEKTVDRFLIREEGRLGAWRKSLAQAGRIVSRSRSDLGSLGASIRSLAGQRLREGNRMVEQTKEILVTVLRTLLIARRRQVGEKEAALRYLDPRNVMKRGFSIVFKGGMLLKDTKNVSAGDIIQTLLYRGELTSTVTGVKGYDEETRADL